MYIYTYIYINISKIAANILMAFKNRCQVGVGVTPFSKLPYSREFSNIWFQNSLLFDGYHRQIEICERFFKNFKNVICSPKLNLKTRF